MHDERKAYDVLTFCTLHGIGRTLAYKEIREGRLKIIKVGRRTLILPEAAKAWLKSMGEVADV